MVQERSVTFSVQHCHELAHLSGSQALDGYSNLLFSVSQGPPWAGTVSHFVMVLKAGRWGTLAAFISGSAREQQPARSHLASKHSSAEALCCGLSCPCSGGDTLALVVLCHPEAQLRRMGGAAFANGFILTTNRHRILERPISKPMHHGCCTLNETGWTNG